MTAGNNTTVAIARTAEDVARLRGRWQSLQYHPDADLDFYLTLLKTRPEILRPHVITATRSDGAESMLVGRVEKTALVVGVGYGKISLPPVRCLTVVGHGWLGDHSEGTVSTFLNSIETSLKNNEADVAWFHRLDENSATYRLVRAAGGALRRDRFPVSGDHWRVRLPGSYDQFIGQRSSNTRHNLKRYTKRFRETYGDQAEIKTFRESTQIEPLMEDTEVVAQKTYHRGLNAGFMKDEETRRRMLLYANEGRLRAHILYIAGKPIAFWNGFLYGRTFFTWTTGFDPEYRDSRPGLFLLQRVFSDLCEEKNIDHVDFGSGDAQYKRDWCDENQREASLYLFAPSVKGVLLNAIRTPLLAASEAARWTLDRTNLLEKTKKLWRSHLAQRPQLEKT